MSDETTPTRTRPRFDFGGRAPRPEQLVQPLPEILASAMGKAAVVEIAPPPPEVFAAVVALCPRDDRVPDRHVFGGFGADRFRTAITRACTAAGIASFSPHDLRHRRVSLLHAQGLPWARIGEAVGHTDLMTTARTYTHVLTDEREIEYADLLAA